MPDFQRLRSARCRYISNRSPAHSAASCPPAPARISRIRSFPSFGLRDEELLELPAQRVGALGGRPRLLFETLGELGVGLGGDELARLRRVLSRAGTRGRGARSARARRTPGRASASGRDRSPPRRTTSRPAPARSGPRCPAADPRRPWRRHPPRRRAAPRRYSSRSSKSRSIDARSGSSIALSALTQRSSYRGSTGASSAGLGGAVRGRRRSDRRRRVGRGTLHLLRLRVLDRDRQLLRDGDERRSHLVELADEGLPLVHEGRDIRSDSSCACASSLRALLPASSACAWASTRIRSASLRAPSTVSFASDRAFSRIRSASWSAISIRVANRLESAS